MDTACKFSQHDMYKMIVLLEYHIKECMAAKEASMAAMGRAVVGRVAVAKEVASETTARAGAARMAARAAAAWAAARLV